MIGLSKNQKNSIDPRKLYWALQLTLVNSLKAKTVYKIQKTQNNSNSSQL